MASGQKFKFQGSSFQVQTGFGTTKTITGITAAEPAVVTSTAHGLPDGTVGRIAAVVGMTELNGGLYVTDNSDVNSFELSGTDSSNYTPYASGGTFAPATFTNFCELTGVDQQDGTADTIEVTTICSTAKEFEQGLSDTGTITLNYNFAPNSNIQTALRAAKVSGDITAFKLVMPGSGGSIIMMGTVQSTSFSGAVNGVYTGSASVKLTGELSVLPAA